MEHSDLRDVLTHIDPAQLEYQEWVNVGMALKQEGYTAHDWDQWSRKDARYKQGECFRKWESFRNENLGAPVAAGTIVEYAKRFGYAPARAYNGPGYALDWGDTINADDLQVVDQDWVEEQDIVEPSDAEWNPVQDLITYLQTLYQSTENVGYVTEVYENEDKLSPKKGHWDRTAGQLLEELRKYNDIGAALGDCNPKAGAWIRFNPLDGVDCKNSNVTDFRFALVESDGISCARQAGIMRELELPIACMVHSGGKSVHGIVRIDAPDYAEYKRRVEYLYRVCDKNGLKVDTQNKNPSRLSRMPGVYRNGKKQFLMATNIGKASWDEWVEWIEGINDDLPDPEDLASVWDDLPPLSECLIDGVLRKGHKMLLAGPSKAGKSFALIELCISIAEGRPWLGFPCARGRVLYVNLELDKASCLHRFRDVYEALGWAPEHISNIDVWNLRGKAVPMDKLAPKLIRRSEKKGYDAVIIDPIYKVITGDENSADQMANFCNQFDKICTQLQAAVIYCHHHSKGAQGGKKSMDRASGSGVFARDPDALLDLVQLEPTDDIRKQENNKARIRGYVRALDQFASGWQDDVSQDDVLSASAMSDYASKRLTFDQMTTAEEYAAEAIAAAEKRTAWRIEGTLREFAPFAPLNLWFDYPVHHSDDSGALQDISVEDDKPFWAKGQKNRKKNADDKRKIDFDEFNEVFDDCAGDRDFVSITDLADTLDVSKRYVAEWFGRGKKARKDYKAAYQITFAEDGTRILKRKKSED